MRGEHVRDHPSLPPSRLDERRIVDVERNEGSELRRRQWKPVLRDGAAAKGPDETAHPAHAREAYASLRNRRLTAHNPAFTGLDL